MGALKSLKCSKGHVMEDPNLYHRGDGKRECLACKKERNRGRKVAVDGGGQGIGSSGSVERSGVRASVPVLRSSEGKSKRVHSVQPVRGKLGGQRTASSKLPQHGPASSASGSCPHGNGTQARCRFKHGGC